MNAASFQSIFCNKIKILEQMFFKVLTKKKYASKIKYRRLPQKLSFIAKDKTERRKMQYINVKISSSMAICQKEYPLSSNDDYAFIFQFDEKWKKEKRKTARLVFDGKYIDIKIKNNIAKPKKIPPCNNLNIGVYSKHYATTLAQIGCIISSVDKEFEKGEYLV